jgi:hypothetical protein
MGPESPMKSIVNSSFWKARPTRWLLLAAIALAWNVPASAAPISYTGTMVAKTGDTIDGKTLTGFKQPYCSTKLLRDCFGLGNLSDPIV